MYTYLFFFILKILTDFRKTVETGMDPRLIMTRKSYCLILARNFRANLQFYSWNYKIVTAKSGAKFVDRINKSNNYDYKCSFIFTYGTKR